VNGRMITKLRGTSFGIWHRVAGCLDSVVRIQGSHIPEEGVLQLHRYESLGTRVLNASTKAGEDSR
jgi:hypothetical protein